MNTHWHPEKSTPLMAWIFLFPSLFFLTCFLFLPMIAVLFLSLTDGNLNQLQWVGLENYKRLLANPDFPRILLNTTYFSLATIAPSTIIPLVLSILLNQNIPLKTLLRTGYFVPSVTSLVAMGLGFRWLFQNNGPVNQILLQLKITPIPWLNSTTWAMPVLILFSCWRQIGFNLVVFLACLQTIPQTQYEAAELDGAGFWGKLWHITLPSLRPTLIFAITTTTIFTLKSFEPVYIITNGGPANSTNILPFYIYEQAFRQFNFGYASAATTFLLIIALIVVLIQIAADKQ
ncbi:MAG: sugar ABC transporter permease [Geminocystis sp.]|nr:sugar ABC transporter permease [Geminocystis sp.]HIK38235.1 sugar ABC transporter permease [Geminocystis sp. M7585_C2015_104]MCS7149076.1 sugar ABC transporter permease [Geminocystis sp.]MCX8078132.1 sugar ABC transporter permease [Geminocystis sp.]MDW8117153.1 sugar ABC transporter permease [Geminocystis sp.]